MCVSPVNIRKYARPSLTCGVGVNYGSFPAGRLLATARGELLLGATRRRKTRNRKPSASSEFGSHQFLPRTTLAVQKVQTHKNTKRADRLMHHDRVPTCADL